MPTRFRNPSKRSWRKAQPLPWKWQCHQAKRWRQLRAAESKQKNSQKLTGLSAADPILVTRAAAGIGEGLPCFGHEFPVVGVWLKRELENAEGRRIAQFAVGLWRAEWAVILAAGADDEFTNAALGIGRAIRRLRGESLVIVIMASDNDIV